MLVAMLILLILAVMTVTLVNVAMETDRIRSSARQVQSYLAGARDRAIFAGAARGVRFILEENGITGSGPGASGPITVTSLVFIGEGGGGGREVGTLRISHVNDPDPGPALRVEQVRYFDTTTNQVETVGTPWPQLYDQALLTAGTRIRLINGSNEIWLGIDARSFQPDPSVGGIPAEMGFLYLSRPHPDYLAGTRDGYFPNTDPSQSQPPVYVPDAEHDLEYEMQFGGTVVLPNQEPVLLARGIVIDLEPVRAQGKLPDAWFDPQNNRYAHIDVMFSPRGTVTGPAAAYGVLHFLLADLGDVERRSGFRVGNPAISNNPPPEVDGFINRDLDGSGTIEEGEQINRGEKVIVTVFTRTGHISTHPVDPTDVRNNASGANAPDGFADDPFWFAEKGDVAR